jgi:RimJ/RimL family protein N-acetyltransferase
VLDSTAVSFELPVRVDLGDAVVRTWTVDDAPALARAMAESYDHLHPWMSWATPEGITEDVCRRFIEGDIAQRAAGADANFGIFPDPADSGGPTVLGGCGLHDRIGPGAIEIGYWLHVAATGKGLMTRVAGTLTDIALARPDIDRVEIHCDEANLASAAVPRRLGYTLIRVEPTVRPGGPASSGKHMIWARGEGVEALIGGTDES